MKRIPLTQGKYALIDDEDYEMIVNYPHPWRYEKNHNMEYAASSQIQSQSTVRMHSLILIAPKGKQVDHINRKGLDNRRANLRAVTQSEQRRNSGKYAKASSKFKGVTWNKARQLWLANICLNKGKLKYLGYFDNEIDAAIAYDKARQSFRKESDTDVVYEM